jgi:kynurenine formamidase
MSRYVDLSHTIRHGMVTYKGLPGPVICDFLSREASRAHYTDGAEFQIGRIDMVANTGTYVDCPFHRYADGRDLNDTPLERFAGLSGLVVRVPHRSRRVVDVEDFRRLDVAGRAVLVATGWDGYFGTPAYFEGHPYLTGAAAAWLRDRGAVLVGIDSHNIDDTTTQNGRPVHTTLLGAGIPIVEHLRGLDALPDAGFRFSAVPPKIAGLGTFPVRAFAEFEDR